MLESKIMGLRREYEAGEQARNDYWRKIQPYHLLLQEYTAFMQGERLDRIEIQQSSLQVVLRNGLRFAWYPQEIRTAPSVLVNHGEYEPQELDMLLRFASEQHIIFDVGANIGWYSLHLAQKVQPYGGMVYAFEPVPHTFDFLEENTHLNPDYRPYIQPQKFGLGEREGIIEFYIPAFLGSVAASRSTLFPEEENQVIEGPMTTLDDFVATHEVARLDLLKCDVEGSELFVLRGALQTIERDQPVIMLEMLRKWAKKFDYHPNDIIGLLASYGYECWYAEDNHFQQLLEMDETCEEVNFFFLHKQKHEATLRQWKAGMSLSDWIRQ